MGVSPPRSPSRKPMRRRPAPRGGRAADAAATVTTSHVSGQDVLSARAEAGGAAASSSEDDPYAMRCSMPSAAQQQRAADLDRETVSFDGVCKHCLRTLNDVPPNL